MVWPNKLRQFVFFRRIRLLGRNQPTVWEGLDFQTMPGSWRGLPLLRSFSVKAQKNILKHTARIILKVSFPAGGREIEGRSGAWRGGHEIVLTNIQTNVWRLRRLDKKHWKWSKTVNWKDHLPGSLLHCYEIFQRDVFFGVFASFRERRVIFFSTIARSVSKTDSTTVISVQNYI